MTDPKFNFKKPDHNLVVQILICIAVAVGPVLGFFVAMSSKLDSLETRQHEQFERLHDDLGTLEARLARDEQTIIGRLDNIDTRLRHVEQLSARQN